MKRGSVILALALIAAISVATTARAWIADGFLLWPNGTVTLRLQLGTAPVYSDGANPNQSAEAAMAMWNPYMGRVQLAGAAGPTTNRTLGNGVNDVFFATTFGGMTFPPGVVATTGIRRSGSQRLETDVVVNSTEQWDAYRGPARFQPELRRVLGHEFGHVLGLTHPDQAGQIVLALMNSFAGDQDTTATDDREGAATLYGPGILNPATPPSIVAGSPLDQTAVEGASVTLAVSVSGSAPFTYQWQKNGVDILTANQATLVLSPVQLSDAGAYSVVVSNSGGSATSRAAQLTVTPAQPVTFLSHPQSLTVTISQSTGLSCSATGSQPITFQWLRNGAPITGATSPFYSIPSVTADHAGEYRVIVTNIKGSVTSNAGTLTVLPLPPPPVVTVFDQTVAVGGFISFNVPFVPGATYQWYKDGQALAGFTGVAMSRANAQPTDAGEYFVVITNAAGSTTSQIGLATVVTPSSNATGGWKSSQRHGDIVYFLFENPARIERFDLASDAFLPAITLPRTPVAMTVFKGYLCVGFAHSYSRFTLDGANEHELGVTAGDLLSITTGSDLLWVISRVSSTSAATITSYDFATMQTKATSSLALFGPPLSITSAGGLLLGRSVSVQPTTFGVPLHPDGTVGTLFFGPNEDTTALFVARTFTSIDEARLVVQTGSVYSVNDLRALGSLGPAFDDIAFAASGDSLVLRGRSVFRYDAGLRETGLFQLAEDAQALAQHGSSVFAFTQPSTSGRAITRQRFDLAALAPRAISDAVDPTDLTFAPNGIFADASGVVHLHSKIHRNIFRWSAAEQRYLPSLPLTGSADLVAYAPTENAVVIVYPDRRITRLPLEAGAAEEQVASAPQQMRNLLTAGDAVVLMTAVAPQNIFVLNSAGVISNQNRSFLTGDALAWNAIKRRIYQGRSGDIERLMYDEVLPDRTLGERKEGPHTTSTTFRPPVRIGPNGDVVLVGSGAFYNADTLAQNNALPETIDDALWLDGSLFTGRTGLRGTELNRWSALNYTREKTAQIDGRLLGMFRVSDQRFVVVTSKHNRPLFTLVDRNLNIRMHATDTAPAGAQMVNLSVRSEIRPGEETLIGGFVVTGSQPKRMLIRAVGPAIGAPPFHVPGVLEDPVLNLFDRFGATVASNDNWGSAGDGAALQQAFAAVGAFGLPPGSADAALLIDLAPGLYTAQVTGANDASGVGLVEVYDTDASSAATQLINLSGRAFVGTDAKVIIPGVVVAGTTPKRVLIRAMGPGLSQHGVSGVLADPQLELMTQQGVVITSNNDWGTGNTAALQAAFAATGAFPVPTDSKDAALLFTLSPGIYTVRVSGVNRATGVALVEVYEVP